MLTDVTMTFFKLSRQEWHFLFQWKNKNALLLQLAWGGFGFSTFLPCTRIADTFSFKKMAIIITTIPKMSLPLQSGVEKNSIVLMRIMLETTRRHTSIVTYAKMPIKLQTYTWTLLTKQFQNHATNHQFDSTRLSHTKKFYIYIYIYISLVSHLVSRIRNQCPTIIT